MQWVLPEGPRITWHDSCQQHATEAVYHTGPICIPALPCLEDLLRFGLTDVPFPVRHNQEGCELGTGGIADCESLMGARTEPGAGTKVELACTD